MEDTNKKGWSQLENSIGLVVGYIIAGMIKVWFFGAPWSKAFSGTYIPAGIAGIALTLFFLMRSKNKVKQVEEE